MQLRELKKGRRYKIVESGKRLVTARLDEIVTGDDGKLKVLFLTAPGNRNVTLRSLAAVKEEVPFVIGAGDVVRIVKGKHKDALPKVYAVERVDGKHAYLVSGGKGLPNAKVLLTDLRHVDDGDPPACFYPKCKVAVTRALDGKPCCVTHWKANQPTTSEDEDRSDPPSTPSVQDVTVPHVSVESPTGSSTTAAPQVLTTDRFSEERIAALEAENAKLKEEIERLKGLNKEPGDVAIDVDVVTANYERLSGSGPDGPD